ncbi:MAG: hypothetical protein FWC11_03580 [Firmicutes bacterium]|nr:hypothetical protein [Bacillota bacterium]
MRYRFDYHVRDIEKFVGRNKWVMLVALIFCVAGIILGVISVFNSSDGAFDSGGWFLIVQNVQRGFLGFFLSRIFTFLILTLIMFLFSARAVLSLLNALVLAIFCFLQARTLAFSIGFLGFSFLPAGIISALALLVQVCILSAIFASLVKCALYTRCHYHRFLHYLRSHYVVNKYALLLLTIVILLEAILFSIFTIGVIL